MDESCKVLQRNCGPSGRWTIALFLSLVVGNFVFSGFLLWKLSVQEKRFEKTVEKLQLDLQELQVEKEEMKQVYETLSEYGGERGKRSEESPSQSSQVTINIAHVFGSFIKQMCKPQSAICIPGQPGRDGLPGLSGKDGSTGLPGLPGRDGEPGRDGLPGRDGPIGLPGLSGKHGPPGRDGRTGLPGPAGRNGEPGSKGSAGKQGPRGIAGRKGDMGVSGEKGERGERGVSGLQGILGPRGEKGEEGDKGERGYPGFKGEKGGKGEIGLPGGKGMKGNKGMKGEKGDEQDLHQSLNLPSQCLQWNHRVLNETWRQTSEHYSKTGYHCDSTGSLHGFTPGWHSFSPTIGGAMPEKCTSMQYCGTTASGWLKGSHPNVIGQKISRTVCFSLSGNCCWRQTSVEVINCGQYYIYNLPNTPTCDLAYCARGQ